MRPQRLVFGEDPELYDRARPSYPAALIDMVVSLVGERARGLDVGCGTGKATLLLAARGLSGVAVEADPSMAAVAKRHLASYPRWAVQVSDFETWNPEFTEGAFDLVCCAQAWHWLDPEVRLSKAHDLLRSEGWLALWWNRPAEDDSAIRLAVDEAYQRCAPELPARGIGSKGVPEIDTIPPGLRFSPPVVQAFEWSKQYTDSEWLALLRTQSDHRLLPAHQLDGLLDAVGNVIRDNGGIYRHLYTTWLWMTRRIG